MKNSRKPTVNHYLWVLAMGILLPSFVHAQDAVVYPSPMVTTLVKPTSIADGEHAIVNVQIRGNTRAQETPLPVSIVLVLDFSSSINKNTAQQIKNAANAILDSL